MLLLDTTLKSLEIVLAGVVTTTELPYVVGYVDISQVDFAMTAVREQDGTTNGITSVTIVPAPAAIPTLTSRQLKFLSISNVDTAVATLTIRVKNTATTRIVWKGTLQVGDNLFYLDDTFLVMDSSGSLKTNFSFGDPLQAIHGGTGIAGYAVGDLLYADTTTTLARRADVAIGSLFASGGVATAPTWSASPTLTTSLTTPTVVGGTAVGSSFSLQSTSGVGTTDFIRFLVGNNGATEAMRITNTGSLGIGTSTPTATSQIHLFSSTASAFQQIETSLADGYALHVLKNPNGRLLIGKERNSGAGLVGGDTANAGVVVIEGANPLQFATNGTVRMTITSGGDVGIGIVSPVAGAQLHTLTSTVPAFQQCETTIATGYSTLAFVTPNGRFLVGKERNTAAGLATGDTAHAGVLSIEGANPLQFATNGIVVMTILSGGNVGVGTTTPAALLTVGSGTSSQYQVDSTFKVVKYANVATTGWGHPAIYGYARPAAGQTAAVTLSTYTVGAADGSFLISANINVTTSTLHNFTVTCAYTDEANNPQTLTFGFTQLSGATFLTAITNVTGAGPYESPVYHLRCKASTSITIATVGGGGFTTVTYNGEGHISQIA